MNECLAAQPKNRWWRPSLLSALELTEHLAGWLRAPAPLWRTHAPCDHRVLHTMVQVHRAAFALPEFFSEAVATAQHAGGGGGVGGPVDGGTASAKRDEEEGQRQRKAEAAFRLSVRVWSMLVYSACCMAFLPFLSLISMLSNRAAGWGHFRWGIRRRQSYEWLVIYIIYI